MLKAHAGAVFILSTGFVLLASKAQQNGSICGVVQDETGRRASAVRVAAMYIGPHSGPYDSAITDANGHYCMEHVRPGEYTMSADDPVKGYPLLGMLFYAPHAPEPRITISAQSLHQIADWTIPYKAGFLRVHATARDTGRTIKNVSLFVAIRENEDLRYMRGGRGADTPILLPPNEDVYVKVNAEGYRPWPAGEENGRLVTVHPGATLDLFAVLDITSQTP